MKYLNLGGKNWIILWSVVLAVGAVLILFGVKTEPFLGPTGFRKPASCKLSGEIEFLEKNLFWNKESKISWKNIDSTGRLINWNVEPKDDLGVGPNLFANLDIPDGEETLTLSLPEKSVSKKYQLKASVTYGQLINDNIEVKEVKCSGSIPIKINF